MDPTLLGTSAFGGTDVGERRSRGSVAGLGCPAGRTAAALPLIAGRRVTKD